MLVNCVPTKVDCTKASISKFFSMVEIVCCFSKLVVGEQWNSKVFTTNFSAWIYGRIRIRVTRLEVSNRDSMFSFVELEKQQPDEQDAKDSNTQTCGKWPKEYINLRLL